MNEPSIPSDALRDVIGKSMAANNISFGGDYMVRTLLLGLRLAGWAIVPRDVPVILNHYDTHDWVDMVEICKLKESD